jgi:nitrous oxidase accessory protein
VVLDKPVTLWGTPDAWVVSGGGSGSVISIRSPHVKVLGLSVDGSGGSYEREDAAISVQGDDVRVQGVHIENAVFGVLANQVHRLVLADNDIRGQADAPRGVRGDGIRLWETYDSQVLRNHLRDGRDLVVWYSPHNLFVDNVVEAGRYGTHFMHASDNVVRRGRFWGNVVGIFVMYSHRITIEDSELVDCSAAGGMGVGIKDSGDVVVRNSQFVHNTSAIYVDNSPSAIDERNLLQQNRFRLNDVAIVFHGNTRGNALRANDFASNREQAVVEGGGDALAASFVGNRFDDYAGYDLDHDGSGDVPYELRSLSAQLSSSHHELSFFRGTAAEFVIEALGRIVPLFAPKTILVDERPRISQPF